jgi:hypothetical protein
MGCNDEKKSASTRLGHRASRSSCQCSPPHRPYQLCTTKKFGRANCKRSYENGRPESRASQLKKDLAEHRQLNGTTLHGEEEVARSIEADIEARIAIMEELLDKFEHS